MTVIGSRAGINLGEGVQWSAGGDQLDHVEQRFPARPRQDEAPARRAEALERADHVPLGIGAILARAGFVQAKDAIERALVAALPEGGDENPPTRDRTSAADGNG